MPQTVDHRDCVEVRCPAECVSPGDQLEDKWWRTRGLLEVKRVTRPEPGGAIVEFDHHPCALIHLEGWQSVLRPRDRLAAHYQTQAEAAPWVMAGQALHDALNDLLLAVQFGALPDEMTAEIHAAGEALVAWERTTPPAALRDWGRFG